MAIKNKKFTNNFNHKAVRKSKLCCVNMCLSVSKIMYMQAWSTFNVFCETGYHGVVVIFEVINKFFLLTTLLNFSVSDHT